MVSGIIETATAPFTGAEREKRAMAEAERLMQGNIDLINQVDLPNLTWDDYKPEEFQYELISEDPMVRSAQLSALERMANLAETGLSAEDELGFYKAQQAGNQLARAGSQAAIQDAQARGVAGSGLEFANREMATQAGAERARAAAMEQAAASARQRALYNQANLQGLSNLRSQDFGVNSANTNIINQFNQANTQQRNQAQLTNQQGRHGVAQQNFANEMTKVGAQTGANSQMTQKYLSEAASAAQDRNKLWEVGGQLGAAYMTGGASAAAPKNKPTANSAGSNEDMFANYV